MCREIVKKIFFSHFFLFFISVCAVGAYVHISGMFFQVYFCNLTFLTKLGWFWFHVYSLVTNQIADRFMAIRWIRGQNKHLEVNISQCLGVNVLCSAVLTQEKGPVWTAPTESSANLFMSGSHLSAVDFLKQSHLWCFIASESNVGNVCIRADCLHVKVNWSPNRHLLCHLPLLKAITHPLNDISAII